MNLSAVLIVSLAASAVSPTPLPVDADRERSLTLETSEDAASIDYASLGDWPRVLISEWRLRILVEDSLAARTCVRNCNDLANSLMADADLALASERVLLSHAMEDRDAAIAMLQDAGTWSTWEVLLLGAGVGIGAAALGLIVGYVVGW